jgi:hypothetical protein
MFNPFAAVPNDKRIPLLLAATMLASVAVFLATTVGETQNPGNEERKLKTKDFQDIPLVVHEVRKLKSDTWYNDLEIEVKNVSKKPIYFILAYLKFPEVPVPDGVYGIALEFGARRNIDHRKDADPRDPHLNPGEKLVFTIPAEMRTGLKRDYEKFPEKMKRLELHFNVISFGDGTGFVAERKRERLQKRAHSTEMRRNHPARSKLSGSVEPVPQDGCGTCGRYIMDEYQYTLCLWEEGHPCLGNLAIPAAGQPCTRKRPINFPCTGGSCYQDEIYEDPICPGYSPPPPSPSPTPEPSSEPSPSPTCNPATRPNPINCSCGPDGQGGVQWACGCADGSEFANNVVYPSNYGCPPDKNYLDGCCYCTAPTQCTSPCHWDEYFCRCVDNAGSPCAACENPPLCDPANGVYTYLAECCCAYNSTTVCESPILIDISGNGFDLTDPSHGVRYDFDGDGIREKLAWTVAGGDDAFLVLDRNNNGLIDNGTEFFGTLTPQPSPPPGVSKNGFIALAEHDRPQNGGNGDGVIDQRDTIYSSLRLWSDWNHNGISGGSELRTLHDVGLKTLEFDYRTSKRRDRYGNQFRYRAKVRDTRDAQIGRWAWDVFLMAG